MGTAWYRLRIHSKHVTAFLFLVVTIFACLSCSSLFKYQMAKESYDQGLQLRELAKDAESQAYFKRTISFLKPQAKKGKLEPGGLLLLGNSYLYIGEMADARKYYWQIIHDTSGGKSLAGIQNSALIGLGNTYELEGYTGVAIEFYESVLSDSSAKSENAQADAGIRWAGVMIKGAENDRSEGNQDGFDKKIQAVIRKLIDLVHRYPSDAHLRRALGNAYFVKSDGVDPETLHQAFTQIMIALDTPSIPVILHRMLMDDFSSICENILQTITNEPEKEKFRKQFVELSKKWNTDTGSN